MSYNLSKTAAIILAAGEGKRMNSHKPKVLQEVLFEPMLQWVIDAVEGANIEKIGIVISEQADEVEQFLAKKGKFQTFVQHERLGTANAVMQAEEIFSDDAALDVLVVCGDAPFVDSETIKNAYISHKSGNYDVTVVTAEVENPFGYGRIVTENGKFVEIVEQKDCNSNISQIKEINSGTYWFKASALKAVLPKITANNVAGEFYLTDTVKLLENCNNFKADNPEIVKGANTRLELMQLNRIARDKVIENLCACGVEIPLDDGIIIQKSVLIGKDTTILPGTIIKGNTIIGENCKIGINCIITDCKIGNNVELDSVVAKDTEIADNVTVGPFVQFRPGTKIASGVKIGDFVEIKNSTIGENTAVAHLTYLGDSDVGGGVNFGCGCVTANFDGINKFRTTIGDNAFIGCNTNLIAPVQVGENATTAAGSTITKAVPANSLAIERGTVRIVENWNKNSMRKKKYVPKSSN